MSLINRVKNGFYIHEASSLNMLHHNHRPMLFIHGAKDNLFQLKWFIVITVQQREAKNCG